MSKKPLKIDEEDPASSGQSQPEQETTTPHLSPKEFARELITKLFFFDLLLTCAVTLYSAMDSHSPLNPAEIALVSFGTLFFATILSALHTYEVRNLFRTEKALANIMKAGVAWLIVMYALCTYTGIAMPLQRTAAWLVLGLGFWRMAVMSMWILRRNVRARMRSRTVVVGWTSMASQLIEASAGEIGSDLDITGCAPTPSGEFSMPPPARVPSIGRYMDLVPLITQRKIDCVILAEHLSQDEFQGLVKICQRSYVDFQVIPSGFPTLRSCLDVHMVGGVPLMGYGSLPLDKVINRILKRTLDIVGSLFGLLLASPLILFFGLCVYIESPGAIFYRQRRATRGGHSFLIYKIRSMKPNAEAGSGAVWCKKDDDRRLKVGAFMRKTNIDELPQFWNVLKGDMSLVGPRPERPELISKFKHDIENYNTRHMVKAGLTGWAAIHGWRGDTDLARRIEADAYYMENWSLSLDLYCIVATLFKIKNAY